MEQAGFEVRDVESLREHYARTLRAWVANLEAHWDEAVGLVGDGRARVWRLYMAGSAVGFDDGGINVHQVLGVVPTQTAPAACPDPRHAGNLSRAGGNPLAHLTVRFGGEGHGRPVELALTGLDRVEQVDRDVGDLDVVAAPRRPWCRRRA